MTSVYKLEKDLCRCCHAEGSFYKLAEPIDSLGQKEIFLDMLKRTLNIEISRMPGEQSAMTFTICGSCVLRLRDAHNFKQQVELCELRFREMYKNIVVDSIIDLVKDEEPSKDVKNELEVNDSDDGFDIRFNDSDDEQPVIEVKIEESGKAKTKPKATKPKAKTKKALSKGRGQTLESEATQEGERGEDVTDKRKKGPKALKYVVQESDYRREGDSYICGKCDKSYYRKSDLLFHIDSKHYRTPRHICNYCNKAFLTQTQLTVHKLEEHDIDERFKCMACVASFNTKVQLRKHTNNFHMLGEKRKCEFCEYESFSFTSMSKHKFKHSIEKNYHCKFCKKSFLRKKTLILHERIHTGDKRKVCKVCGQAFVQKASLNYHMTKYHPEVHF